MLYAGCWRNIPTSADHAAHGRWLTPFLMFRLSGLDDDPKARERIPDGVAAYLERLYYDDRSAVAFAARVTRALLDVADPSHIVRN